ncbi:MAG: cysteine desulfurase CsdA [Pelagibacterales bacterium]|nr:cysteine desulfurase CsdA [Pelagibacterales bacterium]|tara:strand:+ start:108 stop:1346 length:1239 start_codon:yes stop_codon:yes gene_type:complete
MENKKIKYINDFSNIKDEFPIFRNKINGKNLVYLDSAASAQKPKIVINSITNTYENNYANVHRGTYHLSQLATDAYEDARLKVKNFLNATDAKEIIFTRGATEGLNLVANCLINKIIDEGDEILISTLEHHSNLIPWQIGSKQKKAKLVEIKPNANGDISLLKIKKLITKRTKIIALPHVTNSLGSVLPIKEICELANKNNIITVIDGCQAVPHITVDVLDLDCDFYVFSGHKIYGPSGIGALYGKENILNNLDPYQTGGEMIDYVSIEKSTYATLPHKFEAGTPNIVGAISLGYAIDFVQNLGMQNITNHSRMLTEYLLEKIKEDNDIKVLGDPEERLSIVSFLCKKAHPHDLALLLDKRGIALRAGHHCAQPAMRHFNVDTTLRASIGVYNDVEDIDYFLENLNDVKKYF